MSSGLWHRLQCSVEGARRAGAEAAERLAHALALACLALDVADCRRVVLAAADDDRVQHAVELAVAAGVEPVPSHEAGGGGDRGGAGEAGEGGVAAEAAVV